MYGNSYNGILLRKNKDMSVQAIKNVENHKQILLRENQFEPAIFCMIPNIGHFR